MSFKMAKMGKIDLPPGFSLEEKGRFFELRFGGELEPVAIFSSYCYLPSEVVEQIKQAAAEHQAKVCSQIGGAN